MFTATRSRDGVAGFLVKQQLTCVGRRLVAGMPMPEAGVTEFLESVGWIEPVGPESYRTALEQHGAPPEGALKVGWEYEPDLEDDPDPDPVSDSPKPKATTRKRAKKKTTKKKRKRAAPKGARQK